MDPIIDKLLERLRAYDYETYNHSLRVADISGRIASQYGVTYDILQQIRTAGLLHDIGKLGICQEILTKPGKLTNIEYLTFFAFTYAFNDRGITNPGSSPE